jgi:predicted nucleic acid-binding protein
VSKLVVVDTSVFISYFRGQAEDTLAVLILNNQVLLSSVVRLELLAGIRKSEISTIERLCNSLQKIESFPGPDYCEKLLLRARGTGLLGGIPDLLILADVLRYSALLFTYDEKMTRLATKLRVKLLAA